MKRGTYAAWLRMAKFETMDWSADKWHSMYVVDTFKKLEEGEPVSADKFFELFCMQVTFPDVTGKVRMDVRLVYHRSMYRYLKQFLVQPDQIETAHGGHNGDHDGL